MSANEVKERACYLFRRERFFPVIFSHLFLEGAKSVKIISSREMRRLQGNGENAVSSDRADFLCTN